MNGILGGRSYLFRCGACSGIRYKHGGDTRMYRVFVFLRVVRFRSDSPD